MESIKQKFTKELLTAVELKIQIAPNRIKEKTVSAGAFIIKQGDDPKAVFVILEGKVKIYHATMKSNEYLMAIAGPGEIVGELEILTDENFFCSAEALINCRVAVLDRKFYRKWIDKDHKFALLMNQILCSRLQKISSRAAEHLTYPLEYSVLKLIKESALKKSSQTIKISKNEISSYLGTSVRSVNRILKNLHSQNVLSISKNEIQILSMEFLRNLCLSMKINSKKIFQILIKFK